MKTNHRRKVTKRQKGFKGPGYDYWSRRPGPCSPGKFSKKITHTIERQEARRLTRDEIDREAA